MAEQLLRAQSQEQLNNKHYDRLETPFFSLWKVRSCFIGFSLLSEV